MCRYTKLVYFLCFLESEDEMPQFHESETEFEFSGFLRRNKNFLNHPRFDKKRGAIFTTNVFVVQFATFFLSICFK